MAANKDKDKDKGKGKIALMGKATVVPVNFNPAPLRRGEGNGRGGRGAGRGTPDPTRLTAIQVAKMPDQRLKDSGALVRINDAGMDQGLIRAFQNRPYDVNKAVPTVVPLVVGEIPGTDKADEVVMLDGHPDSWHAATGATDNAIESSMMMEAAHIIHALSLKPRRTIRVALWSGEEEGLLGSAAYVKQHFGTFEDPKPEYAKFDGYFNIDSGTGRVRGAGVFGPPSAAEMISAALAPYKEWMVGTANATTSRADSTNFNAAGLPGIGLQKDPIESRSFTWHTNLDTHKRIVPEDVK